MPEVLERLASARPRCLAPALQIVERIHRPDAPRMDFVIALCDTLHGQSVPDFGDKFVTGAWPLPDPAKFTGIGAERATLLNELYAHDPPAASRSSPACPSPRSTGWRSKARLDEIGDTAAHRALIGGYAMSVGINGMGRIGRLALRAALGGVQRAADDPRADNRLDVVHVNETQGRRRGDRASPRVRQHPWPLARSVRRRRRQAIIDRQQAHRLQRARRRRATCRGAISAATSCWNAPASSSSPSSCKAYFERGVKRVIVAAPVKDEPR